MSKEYNKGLSDGVMMTDPEALRFYNGCVAAVPDSMFRHTHDPYQARVNILPVLTEMYKSGMVATIGVFGTPEIKQLTLEPA